MSPIFPLSPIWPFLAFIGSEYPHTLYAIFPEPFITPYAHSHTVEWFFLKSWNLTSSTYKWRSWNSGNLNDFPSPTASNNRNWAENHWNVAPVEKKLDGDSWIFPEAVFAAVQLLNWPHREQFPKCVQRCSSVKGSVVILLSPVGNSWGKLDDWREFCLTKYFSNYFIFFFNSEKT